MSLATFDALQMTELLDAHDEVLERLVLGGSLPDVLNTICEGIEKALGEDDFYSSILLLVDEKHLVHGAAPRLSDDYLQAIDGGEIGFGQGSCGTAAFLNEQVIVEDILTDPLWQDAFKQIAMNEGLRACWSTPIRSSQKKVLGTFALYYSSQKSPEPHHLELIQRFTHLSRLAIEKDLADRREKELVDALRHSNEKLEALIQVLPDLYLILDEDGRHVDYYGADKENLLVKPPRFLGKTVDELMPEALAQKINGVIRRTLETGEVQVCEYPLDVLAGSRYFEGRTAVVRHYTPEEPDKQHVLWLARDITEHKEADRRIEELAYFDPLTNLPNRRFLMERLEKTCCQLAPFGTVAALMFLDLDDFKRINDSLGHNVGDILLCKVSHRLQRLLGEDAGKVVARIGGDEFVVLLEATEEHPYCLRSEAELVSRKLLAGFAQPFSLDGGDYRFHCSIGIALVEGQSMRPEQVLMHADTAMYQAKRLGGHQYAFYEASLQKVADTRLQVERELGQALEQGDIRAHFQPQVDKHGQPMGAEALVRWQSLNHGMVSPAHFIPVAERSGLIHRLQEVVLQNACDLLKRMEEADVLDDDFTLSINISPIQFSASLDESLCRQLAEAGVSPGRIKLEVTESMLLDDIDMVVKQMHALREKDFRLSIDDFGTGYSSLAYLQKFPIDELKIDRSFTQALDQGKEGRVIIDAMTSLGQHLSYRVIVEGVETLEQVKTLTQCPISGMQGFYWAKPMPADDFVIWMKEKRKKG